MGIGHRYKKRSARSPVGVAGEEAIHETDIVTDKNPKTQAKKTGAKDEAAIEPSETMACKRKRQGQRRGNQHHTRNRANTENKQI